jgi:hypothetical protein
MSSFLPSRSSTAFLPFHVRRAPSPLTILPVALRFMACLLYFAVGSALVLAESFSLPAAVAAALACSVFSHEIGTQLSARRWSENDSFDPLRGACLLLVELVLTVPPIAFLLSPASYGPDMSSPHTLLPAFTVLLLPCCIIFAVVQRHTRSHNRLLVRLGLRAVLPSQR